MHRTRKLLAIVSIAAATLAGQQPTPPAPQAAPQAAQPQTQAQPPVQMGALNLQNASLTEVIDQLARMLHINYIIDPSVKGGVTLNTYGDLRNVDPRNLLEQILRINGFGMTEVGGVYRIVSLKDMPHQPIRPQVNAQNIPEDDRTMLNIVFLKYVSVEELVKVLQEFVGENARLVEYPPANILFILDSRRNMRRTMELIDMFDSDTFANQRVHIFDVKNARPSDLVKELDNIFKSISLDTKTGTVKFLPVDRINEVIAVAPNAGVFATIEEWLKKLDVPVKITAGAVENYVYIVKYQQSQCLAQALGQLFGTTGTGYGGAGQPYGGYGSQAYGGGYGGGYGGYGGGGGGGGYGGGYGGNAGYGTGYGNPGGYGNANNFTSGFGGNGVCGPYGGAGAFGMQPPTYGYPAFGGYAAQTAAGSPIGATGQPLAAAAQAGAAPAAPGADTTKPPRIVPNPLDNKLLIQADAQQYQNILKVLKELDVPPRQILLEAKIYEVDLTDNFASGISYALQARSSTQGQVSLPALASGSGIGTLTVGALVANGRELLATLTLNENATHVHMMSEPSLIATDSIPASINVGTQVPVSTGSTTIPAGGSTVTSESLSSENTGITLQVNARVSPTGIVTLIVNQEISSINASLSTSVSTPAFNQQTVQTQITMMDGDTIAIGGTISDNVTDATNGIPFLSKLPGIGSLFGSKSHGHSRSELIIFMTPHVIYDETNLIEASDELKARVKLLRKMVRNL